MAVQRRQTSGGPYPWAHPQPFGHLQVYGLFSLGQVLSILPFHKHSLSAACVPGVVLGTRDTAGNKTSKNARLIELTVDWWRGRDGGRHARSVIPPSGHHQAQPTWGQPTYPPCWFTAPASALPEPQGRMPTGVFTASSQSGRSRSPFSTWRARDQTPGCWSQPPKFPPGSGQGAPALPHTAAHLLRA